MTVDASDLVIGICVLSHHPLTDVCIGEVSHIGVEISSVNEGLEDQCSLQLILHRYICSTLLSIDGRNHILDHVVICIQLHLLLGHLNFHYFSFLFVLVLRIYVDL